MKPHASPSRTVRFVQGMISFLAPPLHSLHWKIFLLCLAAVFLPGVYFAWKVGQGIERSHLRSTEEGMIDTALVVAEGLELSAPSGLERTREIRRSVFHDLAPNLRVVVYSPGGTVVHDTSSTWSPGTDRSAASDVRKALRGGYGAKWERDTYRRAVVLFSTIPVLKNGEVTALVSVIKSTADVRRSVIRSLTDLILPALLAFSLAALVAFALSTYVTGILKNLAARADRVAAGESAVRLETWSKSEFGDLSRALEKMRSRLEGKQYVEETALTLSHEIKTPIAAIRGAAEILQQTMDPAVKRKFFANIFAEADRLSALVGNFLALSRIESAPPDTLAQSSLPSVASGVAETFRNRASHIQFQNEIAQAPCRRNSAAARPPRSASFTKNPKPNHDTTPSLRHPVHHHLHRRRLDHSWNRPWRAHKPVAGRLLALGRRWLGAALAANPAGGMASGARQQGWTQTHPTHQKRGGSDPAL